MTVPTWTKEELAEFDSLINAVSSSDQMERIIARLDMPKFIEKHGKARCDAMYAHLLSDECRNAAGKTKGNKK